MSRNRMVQKAMFTDVRALRLSPASKWFLQGLMKEADDKTGNVLLDSKFLMNNVVAYFGQTIDEVESWIAELAGQDVITIYFVGQTRYACITEWTVRDGLTFQYIKKPFGSKYPCADDIAKANTEVAEEEPPPIKKSLRSLPRRKPQNVQKDPDPRPTTKKTLSKPLRAVQRAEWVDEDDEDEAIQARLREKLTAMGGRTRAMNAGSSIASRIGESWRTYPGAGRQGLDWLRKHNIQDHEFADAEDYLNSRLQTQWA